MTEAMRFLLSQPMDAGEKKRPGASITTASLYISTVKTTSRLIQRAARKIDGMGIKHVALSGEGWNTDRAWAFWAGYKGPKVSVRSNGHPARRRAAQRRAG
ncbi:hypothetical protein MJ579_21405 [Klebsiella pneumoniae]|nr:hypothetical protein MJ579_21405 [Klebsiella pneumoniae]